jgi:peptide-methionine (R)-S-oxide reductase
MNKNSENIKQKVVKTNEEWRNQLSPLAYKVLREKETERAFTGEFDNHSEKGTYYCTGCNNVLFESSSKFHSGCGWPSFTIPFKSKNIKEILNKSHGMIRTEIQCTKCGGHLGHVFNDGPPPTGLRYCINSVSLRFEANLQSK